MKSLTIGMVSAFIMLSACSTTNELTLEQIVAADEVWEQADPVAMRKEDDCISSVTLTASATGFRDRVFEGRFLLVERSRKDAYLIEFTRRCDSAFSSLVYPTPSAQRSRITPRGFQGADFPSVSRKARSPSLGRVCRSQPLNFATGETCLVDDVFEVPNEMMARALALKIQMVENEEATMKRLDPDWEKETASVQSEAE